MQVSIEGMGLDVSVSYPESFSCPLLYLSYSGVNAPQPWILQLIEYCYADIKHMEGLMPKNYGADVVEIPGARDLLDAVVKADIPWAIVTSGTTPLVTGWLDVLKFPVPEYLVVAEDVENGKPDPQCYLMGKEKLRLGEQAEVLVLEDSPAGIAAGKAAGCKVLAVVTSHTVEQVLAAKPDWIVKDLKSVKVVRHAEAGVELEILDALRSE
jgi:glycerol-1-phosphatase